jgi:hypothetical protein
LLVDAYRAAQPRERRDPSAGDFDEDLDYCRLHLAVQWLGWAVDWAPPDEHRQDWLEVALELAGELGL